MPLESSMRVFAVLNPVAGQSRPEVIRRVLDRRLRGEGHCYELYETTGEENLTEVVREALGRGCDVCLAIGGDGTVAAVASALVHGDVPLAIMPVGTGNVLARELQIPRRLGRALRLLSGPHERVAIDAFLAGRRLCFLNLSVGLTSLAVYGTGQAEKRRLGRVAYVWGGLKALLGIQPQRFTVTVDGQPHQFRASDIMVANCGCIGEPILRLGKQIRMDDGQIDVCILRARHLLDYVVLVWGLLFPLTARAPKLRYLAARNEIIVEAQGQLDVQADGEPLGETPVRVRIVPRAVQIIVPIGSRKA